MSKVWPQHRGAELGVSADIFGNYNVPYEEESPHTSLYSLYIQVQVKHFFLLLLHVVLVLLPVDKSV